MKREREAQLIYVVRGKISRALLFACLVLNSTTAVIAQAPARNVDVSGKWEFVVESPQAGSNTMTITFARVDGALTGNGQSQSGTLTVRDVAVAANDLSFVMLFEAEGGDVYEIPFKGKVNVPRPRGRPR
jgi:hypothetical protein